MNSSSSSGFPSRHCEWRCGYKVKKMDEEPSSCNMDNKNKPESKRIKTTDHCLTGGLTARESSPFMVSQSTEFLVTHEDFYANQQSQDNSVDMSTSMITLPLSSGDSNPVKEVSPLGLTLRKTQSLIDLIQRNLEESTQSNEPDDGLEEKTKNKGATITDNQHDKLKASNFPACCLKIGKWERSSIYEGDLVAKCYYAKRKLVWEVLDNGLKSKIEIQWSEITGLKADMPEKGPATLHVEISRTPMFFRETNPQPRKHTLWQSTSDFTGGQASICRWHRLQFAEGVLNRHFEKLIQCDKRLKNLSEQSVPFSGSPFFEGGILMLDLQRNSQILYPADVSSPTAIYETLQSNMAIPFCQNAASYVKQDNVHAMEVPTKRELAKPRAFSPSSVMDSKVNDDSSNSDIEDVYAREFQKHAGYKKTGTSILRDQNLWRSDRTASSTSNHGISNIVSSAMPSCVDLPVGKGSKSLDVHENNKSDTKQNILQSLFHQLLEDDMSERVHPREEIKFFPESFTQDSDPKSGQMNLVRSDLPDSSIMTDSTHAYLNGSFNFGIDKIGYPADTGEDKKGMQLNFKTVKMEEYLPSQQESDIFSFPGNNSLGAGLDKNQCQLFRDVTQAPRFFLK
eukprot:TRINITY_DN23709_c0_g1_i1.p1 TRINITY_DN23709_c0_g1~~TRINITY_DN23709_c0_g1_i1.p1  ORF type:complete len:624 (-),score=117.56 TRINITY_DN23709_c0_g1_i1:56-1927(-)